VNAPSFRLENGDVVVIDAHEMEVVYRDPASLTLKPIGESPYGVRTYTNEELLALYFDRRLKVVRQPSARLPERVKEALERSPDSFDKHWQLEMLRRLDFVQICDRIFVLRSRRPGFSRRPETGYARIAFFVARLRRRRAAQLAGKRPWQMALEVVSGSTLRAWHRRWIQANRELTALAPLHHHKGHPLKKRRAGMLDPVVTQLIAQYVRQRWLTLERPPVSIVHRLICRDIDKRNASGAHDTTLSHPSEMAVHRWIKANVGDYERVFYREGRKAADARVKATRPAPAVGIPLRVVEVDHTRLDIVLVDAAGKPIRKGPPDADLAVVGRPWLTTLIDAETRMVVGYYLDYIAPSWISVMNALRMGVLEKDLADLDLDAASPWPVMGLPEILVLDNGKEFHSAALKSAAGLLKFELRYCRRGAPHLKGRVERFFGEIARDYCALPPGKTFANVVEKADYQPGRHARMTLEVARQQLKLWITQIYHNKPHGGLWGKTPLQRWQELSGYGVRLPPKAEDLDVLLGLAEEGQIHRDGGIRYLGLHFQSKEVDALRLRPGQGRAKFMFKVDPQDLTSLHVLDPQSGKWLLALCLEASLVEGLDIRMWKETCERGRRMTPEGERVTYAALMEARETIAEEARQMGKKRRDRITPHDLAWIKANPNSPIFDIDPDPAASWRKRGDRKGAGAGKASSASSASRSGGAPLPEQDISGHRRHPEHAARDAAREEEEAARIEDDVRDDEPDHSPAEDGSPSAPSETRTYANERRGRGADHDNPRGATREAETPASAPPGDSTPEDVPPNAQCDESSPPGPAESAAAATPADATQPDKAAATRPDQAVGSGQDEAAAPASDRNPFAFARRY